MGSVTSMFWRDKCQTNSLTHNSMSPVPKNKFINYARQIRKEPHELPKSIKQREQLEGYKFDYYYDKLNH